MDVFLLDQSWYGVRDGDIATAWVPGSFELPVVAKTLAASGRYDAVICLGAVIRGETGHYDMVCNQAASGIAAVGRETGIPTMFGVLTTENMEQAINRSGGKVGNLGVDCAVVASGFWRDSYFRGTGPYGGRRQPGRRT